MEEPFGDNFSEEFYLEEVEYNHEEDKWNHIMDPAKEEFTTYVTDQFSTYTMNQFNTE